MENSNLTTEKVENTFNMIIRVFMIIFILTLAVNINTVLNLKNSSPSSFLGIKVGKDPKIVKVIVQSTPVQNQESIKQWIKISTNHFFNYNVNNYKDVLKTGRPFLTENFYKRFTVPRALKVIEIFNSGYQISSSIVDNEPLLIGAAKINGIQYYKYFIETSTVYKSEIKHVITKHSIIVTVKIENPEDNPNGIAIDEMNIK
jgi:glycerophosphoryl diester phosphodiesterase